MGCVQIRGLPIKREETQLCQIAWHPNGRYEVRVRVKFRVSMLAAMRVSCSSGPKLLFPPHLTYHPAPFFSVLAVPQIGKVAVYNPETG